MNVVVLVCVCVCVAVLHVLQANTVSGTTEVRFKSTKDGPSFPPALRVFLMSKDSHTIKTTRAHSHIKLEKGD